MRQIPVGGGLHPRMPEKPVDIRAIALLGVVDVSDGNEPVPGKLLHKRDDIAA